MMSAARVVRSTVGLLAVGFLALLLIVGMTLQLGERAQVHFDDAIAARDTRASAVELRSAVQTAESSQRGYLVTGNQIYLAPYSTAKTLAQRQLDTVKQLLAPHEETHVALRRLTSLVAEKFDEMDGTIALKRDRRDAEALAIIRSNRGKALMDEANVFFAGIIRAADERLTRGVDEQKENAAKLRSTTIASGVLIFAVVAVVVITVVRYTRELAKTREEVESLNSTLERRVEERTAELARANREIQRFAQIVTHDLRAPLISIVGFTGELEGSLGGVRAFVESRSAGGDDAAGQDARRAVGEDVPEAIGFIRSSARRMDGLIAGILKLSREGGRSLHPEPVAVGDVMRANAAAIRHQLSGANGTITLEVDVPPIVTDRSSLEQIAANLLDNAVKYRSTERPLTIDVRARTAPGDRIAIDVTDNGRGIAEGDQERVFDLFRRVGAQDQPGEGIGLAHVRTMARNLGGEVTVTSVLGVGTTFRLVLPSLLRIDEAAAA